MRSESVHWACPNSRRGPERKDCSAKASASSLNQTEWAQRDERAVRPPLYLGRVTIQVPRQKPAQGQIWCASAQPDPAKIGGLTNLWRIATEAETAGVTCVPHAFFFGPGYLATLHAISAKERAAPLERLFADVGFTAYSKTVPVENGAVDVPERPGLGADPEAEILERYTV
jgi:L-alanine-DL-glutamate epimerase-like enolase superfamily enzyme